jgi:hypothetical protein
MKNDKVSNEKKFEDEMNKVKKKKKVLLEDGTMNALGLENPAEIEIDSKD